MPNLVTEEEVKELTKSNDGVATFIETAHLFVTENLAGQGLSASRLKQIELYLAAHFVTITTERGGIIGKKVGESSEFYANKFGKGLGLTRFGQQVSVLDTTGILTAIGSGENKAQFRVV